jgi:hypothetical protein
MKKHFFFGAIFLLFLSLPIFAQQPTNQTTNQQTTDAADEKNSDLVITATVRAKELKFEVVPNPKVEFPGNKPRQTVWEADRTNLPKPLEPGVIYRDIGIRLRIFSRFSEIQRIVLEALDEENPPDPAPANISQTNGAANQPNKTTQPPAKPQR